MHRSFYHTVYFTPICILTIPKLENGNLTNNNVHFGSRTFEYDSFFHINQYSNIVQTISKRLNEHLPHGMYDEGQLKKKLSQLTKIGKTII